MTPVTNLYKDYLDCLNNRTLQNLKQFVHEHVCYNGRAIGLSGYIEMLETNFIEIPDLYFDIQLLISDRDYIASRLNFNCTPKGSFLGIPINGKRITFSENVFYQFQEGKIAQVWSVIDKKAIEAQAISN